MTESRSGQSSMRSRPRPEWRRTDSPRGKCVWLARRSGSWASSRPPGPADRHATPPGPGLSTRVECALPMSRAGPGPRTRHEAPSRVVATHGHAAPVPGAGAHPRRAANPVPGREGARPLVYPRLAGRHHAVPGAARHREGPRHPPGRGGSAPPALPGHGLGALGAERLPHGLGPVGDRQPVAPGDGAGRRRERPAAGTTSVAPGAVGLAPPPAGSLVAAPRAAPPHMPVKEGGVPGLGGGPVPELARTPTAVPHGHL